MTTYICAYAFICFIYELYVDETEINYETETVIMAIMYGHVNNYKTQYSSRSHKSKSTVYKT